MGNGKPTNHVVTRCIRRKRRPIKRLILELLKKEKWKRIFDMGPAMNEVVME